MQPINVILIVYLIFAAMQDYKYGKVKFTDLLFGLLIGLASFVVDPKPYALLFIMLLLAFASIQRKLKLNYIGEADIYIFAIILLTLPTMQAVLILILSLILAVIFNFIGLKFMKHPNFDGIKGIPVILMITLISFFF